jgi:diguanylate cyclase (GGDEF)-like protein/PAS domain S-box-containing protein
VHRYRYHVFTKTLQTLLGFCVVAIASRSPSPVLANTGPEPVTVGIYDNPPKLFLTDQGQPQGFWPDLLNTVAAAEDWQLQYVPCYWDQCLEMVEQGKLDLMIDVAFTAEREQRFDFNQEPVLSSWSVVYVKRGLTLHSILDLDQKRVAVLKDSIQQEVLAQQANDYDIAVQLVEVKDFEEVFDRLVAGEVDAGVVNRLLGAKMERQLPVQATNILIKPSRLHVITGNGTHAALLADFDRALRQLKADPNSEYYQALNQWLAPPPPTLAQQIRPALPALMVLMGGTALLFSVLWNRSLRQEVRRRQGIEDRLQRLVDNTPGVIFQCQRRADGTYHLPYVSPGSLPLWELAPETIMTNPEALWRLIAPQDLRRLRQSLEQSARTLEPWVTEWQITPPSGRQLWMQLAAKPHALSQGDVVWDGLVLDVTDRKQQEAEREVMETSLRQSEATLWKILEAIPDLLLWTRPDGTCVGVSEGQDLENLLPEDGHLNTNQYDLLPPELHPQRKAAFERALETGKIQVYEQELTIGDSHQYEEVRIVPVDPDLLLVIVRDISDRKRREIERIRNEAYRQRAEQALRDSERRYRQVVEAQTDFILRSRPDTTITFANDALCQTLGMSPAEVVGKRWQDLADPDDLEADAFKGLAQLTPNKPRFFAENRDRRADGQTGWTQWLNQGIFDNQGQLIEIQSVGRDITALKQAEQAARESENRYRLVAENISDLVCLNDVEGRYLYVSPSVKSQLGYDPEALIGQTFYQLIHPDEQERLRQEVHQPTINGAVIPPFTHRVRTQAGDYLWVETLINPIFDETGTVTQFQTTSRDVTDRVRVEQQLRHAALHDSLTGLPNRTVLMERLESVIEQHQGDSSQQSALLFLDLDQFKVINDSLGHLTGDKLLIWVADKLNQVVRATDIVARISGDEFVILLENLDHENHALHIAERVLEELKAPFVIDEREIFITSSIGIVLNFGPYITAEDLVRDADIAMYQAKASGRANYAVFDPQMRIQVVERMNLSNDLRRAMQNQELLLYYQPIVALESLTVEGVEVLLRWQHPRLGLVCPDQFVPLAEETGLIVAIGNWLLQTACQQLAAWRQQVTGAQDLRLSVNLSVRQLQSNDLLAQFDQVLAVSGIPPEALTLEITESLLVQNFERTHQLLSEVQAKGIHVSIDDFGTGYSSLSYLHRLPVDALKIDRAFISYMGQDAKNQTIAESIIALSNVLGLNAIAEGIETVDQLNWLQDHGCEYGQGYLFSRPIPAQEVTTLLQQDLMASIPSHHRRLPVAKAGHMPPVRPISNNRPN